MHSYNIIIPIKLIGKSFYFCVKILQYTDALAESSFNAPRFLNKYIHNYNAYSKNSFFILKTTSFQEKEPDDSIEHLNRNCNYFQYEQNLF